MPGAAGECDDGSGGSEQVVEEEEEEEIKREGRVTGSFGRGFTTWCHQ